MLTEKDHLHMQNESILRKCIETFVEEYNQKENKTLGQQAAIKLMEYLTSIWRNKLDIDPTLDYSDMKNTIYEACEILENFAARINLAQKGI